MRKNYIGILMLILCAIPILAVPQPTYWYKFDGNSADSADSLDLTAVNGVTFSSSDKMQGSHSASFDGLDDYFGTEVFPTEYDNITIAAWVKPIGEEEHYFIFGQDGQDPSNSYDLKFFIYFTNELWLQIHNGIDQDTKSELPDGYKDNWIHLSAVIADGKKTIFYVNGQEVQSYNDQDQTSFNAWDPIMRIGTRANPDTIIPFKGLMDDYRIWIDTAITDQDIDDAYSQAFEDNLPPTIQAPENVVIECESPEGTSNVDLGEPQVSDDNDQPEDILVQNDAPSEFPFGNTQVTWAATDSGGLHTTDTQQVTVVDTYTPSISASLTATNLSKSKGIFKVDFGAKDTCDDTLSITATVNRKTVNDGDVVVLFKRAPPSKFTCTESNALIVFAKDSSNNMAVRVVHPDFS